jgi:hypothetical protein
VLILRSCGSVVGILHAGFFCPARARSHRCERQTQTWPDRATKWPYSYDIEHVTATECDRRDATATLQRQNVHSVSDFAYGSTPMAFQILEVTSPAEFDEIWPVHFQSFRTPYNTLSKFFNPVHTTLEAAIETSKARHVEMWAGNPGCHWLKVVSTESGKVVGAVCWLINLEVQKREQEKGGFDAYWHVEGSDEKAFAERLIGGLRGVVKERVGGPHVGKIPTAVVREGVGIHAYGS